jgi:hypothetical protein
VTPSAQVRSKKHHVTMVCPPQERLAAVRNEVAAQWKVARVVLAEGNHHRVGLGPLVACSHSSN